MEAGSIAIFEVGLSEVESDEIENMIDLRLSEQSYGLSRGTEGVFI